VKRTSSAHRQDIIYAVNEGDIEALRAMQVHGQDLNGFRNEEDVGNTAMHYAVRSN